MRTLIKILSIFGIVAILATILYIRGFFLPSYIQWKNINLSMDLNRDGIKEIYQLKNKQAIIQFENETYEFDREWFISDIKIDDIDQDGVKELLMLVWNRTNYGDYSPFWDTNDTLHFSQHLYVFTIQNDSIHSKWMSSSLRPIIKNWEIRNHELVLTDPDDETTVWKWIDFGFERIE